MTIPWRKPFIRLSWDADRTWLVVRLQLRLAMGIALVTRWLHGAGLLPDAAVEHAIEVSNNLMRRSSAAWDAYLQRRDAGRSRPGPWR